jgi:hypothetical protein
MLGKFACRERKELVIKQGARLAILPRMASSSLQLSSVPAMTGSADRRLAGVAVTVFVHAALILGWQMARTPPPAQAEGDEPAIQWLRLPVPAPRVEAPPVVPQVEARPHSRPTPDRAARPGPTPVTAAPAPAAAQAPVAVEPQAAPAAIVEAPARPSVEAIMESARRSVGSIDRALRKESKATIVAPPDSPQIRMREGMEQAHALAPPRLWEAPKVEELVNNTGDGARRTRVITGNGTYCITERSPATNIEMIEMHGKQRITNCPKDETPAKKQVWRTARD